jgi:hypothetical protein
MSFQMVFVNDVVVWQPLGCMQELPKPKISAELHKNALSVHPQWGVLDAGASAWTVCVTAQDMCCGSLCCDDVQCLQSSKCHKFGPVRREL